MTAATIIVPLIIVGVIYLLVSDKMHAIIGFVLVLQIKKGHVGFFFGKTERPSRCAYKTSM